MTDSSYLMFCGSYSDFDILAHLPKTDRPGKGVYVFHFHNGEIKPLSVIPSSNPAVLSFHPSDPKTMYVLAEGIKENGMISKVEYDYKFDKDSKSVHDFKIIGNDDKHQQTGGQSLCYFKVCPESLQYGIAINYWDGSADVYKMNETSISGLHEHIDHMKLAKSLQTEQEAKTNKRRQVVNREDHWKHRQVGPHAHSVHYYKNWVFIPDLGENCIFQYGWNPKQGVIMDFESQMKLPEGAGPRHMVFHPHLKVAYVSNELNSSISVIALDDSEVEKVKCRMKIIQNINTDKDMAEEADIWKKNYVAEIGISHDGKFIYCSNRGYDTIAVYKVLLDKNGILEPVSYVSTYGKTPRHFSITPDNKYLIGANQDSNNMCVFQRDLEKGTLTLLKKYENIIDAPNYVLFSPFNVCDVDNKQSEKQQNGNGNGNLSILLMVTCVFAAIVYKLLV